ncbi:MAG TPA: helix-turn-helix domain-containing protein [Candidatus Tetragenococcus pullicola]|nr:helix-turn-helix domain-containing protein [Candidatus Tetragenococcus pullicola]
MEFGEQLKKLRIARGISPTQLSYKSGVGNSQIVRYENGERKDPKFSTVKRLARGLNVPLNYFDDYRGETEVQKQIIGHIRDDITPEEVAEIIDFMEFVQSRHRKTTKPPVS